ncbi:P53 DNA-Hypothetical protein domain [Nesidiocoris tenuis]|uniref:p53 DNA-binding domain-containing protein n=1 Tax=Nesidiocoris tenuis TaxID=355587 RepID=A0ABN7AVG4_9HEMI|nr:P53 DNA-Hypothetical protein domain [Nesidiocoris tenuis]
MTMIAGDLVETIIKTEDGSDEEVPVKRKRRRVHQNVNNASTSSDEADASQMQLTMSDMTTNFHDSRLPMMEDFPGPYDFRHELSKTDHPSVRATWEYSALYRQVLIKLGRVLLVHFNVTRDKDAGSEDLYIRALLVYSSSDHVYSPVNRCAVHAIEDDRLSRAHAEPGRCFCPQYKLAGHVVRTNSANAIYCFDPRSQRHSVLCPVQGRTDFMYTFVCKNSCPKGLNRRQTKLVFTLENSSGQMLGRSSIDLKICSCPRRDREKLEKAYKNPLENGVPTGSPERSEEEDNDGGSNDNDVIDIPGEVIMKLRSEIRNIRQALHVVDRRVTNIHGLITGAQ